jgi:CheY-like chemotaxis protein
MPGMDGLELADTIRNQIVPAPKLVMVTATDTATLDGETRLNCFDAVLNKPVTAAQIGKLIDQGDVPVVAPAGKPAPLAGVRVLLVEDMPTNQLIATEILESFGITVDVADNGVQALKKLLDEGNSYDMVLMDIQMPEMDGLEATRRLRASGKLSRLPIIAMTAHAMDSERQRCLDIGMNDFVTKPIDPDGLRDILIRWRPTQASPVQAKNMESAPMSSADGLPDLPGIDKADGLRRMMNKPALYEKVLRDFHARFMTEPKVIREAMQAGDYATAERRAHSTKGLAGTIGALGLQNASKELELALRQGERPHDSLFQQFENELKHRHRRHRPRFQHRVGASKILRRLPDDIGLRTTPACSFQHVDQRPGALTKRHDRLLLLAILVDFVLYWRRLSALHRLPKRARCIGHFSLGKCAASRTFLADCLQQCSSCLGKHQDFSGFAG